MKLRIAVLLVAWLGCALLAEEPAVLEQVVNPAVAPATVKDGYALLNSLLTLFENLPVTKKSSEPDPQVSAGLTEVDRRLSQLGVDSKAAMEASVIDKIFYYRYRRMLTIFKLITMPIIRGELLKDLFMRTFNDFVWDVTYENWSWEDKDSIPKMAAAMEEEFVQMQFYLDSRQARAEFKKKIGKRILPPPPPPASAKKK